MLLVLDIPEIDTDFVRDVLEALTKYNARTWRCLYEAGGVCPAAPWLVRYIADKPAPRVWMRDIFGLLKRGHGSCGELAAAYAGYARALGKQAHVVVEETGQDRWHAYAVIDGQRFEPSTIGAR